MKKKWETYRLLSENFNERFNPDTHILCPALEIVKRLPLEDVFWNVGNLTHPDEAWAVDINTQKGIQAHLTITHLQDELSRIARELRQLVLWALAMDEKAQKAELQVITGELF